jgi:high-affinity iron transporter
MIRTLLLAATLVAWPLGAAAQEPATVVHLLDYIAVDYGEAVADGAVRNADEYREMREFAANVADAVAALGERPRKVELVGQAAALRKRIEARASPAEIALAAARMKDLLIDAYAIEIGPRRAPDVARGSALFATHCAACHGPQGRGDGPLAKGMEPSPSDFHDAQRPALRSIHGLFNTISLGVAGTPMRAFRELSQNERWALAYRVAAWGVGDAQAERGRSAWHAGQWRAAFASQAAVAGHSRHDIAARQGDEAASVAAYLTRSPQEIDASKPAPIALARERIGASEVLYREGRRAEAFQAALSAYLDGFELAEAGIGAVDAQLVRRLETEMMAYREAIKAGAATERIAAMAAQVRAGLDEAAARLAASALTPASAAAASFVILLREGLEAVLVVAALAAFLRRSGQARAMPYLHAGWIGALALGALTWMAGTWLVELSGAGRETTEGVTALVASAMLLYVGFWLHDKSHAKSWQRFLMQGASAVRPGAAWGLAGMAFIAVYREVFETVLFYQALWTQAPGAAWAIVAGLAAAAASLAAIAWAMLRFAVRLPLALFFGASGLLLAAMGVVLAGNGIAALQEAGLMAISPAPIHEIRWLGLHATWQSIAAQGVATALVVALYVLSRARARARLQEAAAD